MTNHAFKTGESREQPSLLPPRIEDYVGRNNPVRAIESFVGALDLAKLGFRRADRGVELGQPPFDPADLLKRVGRNSAAYSANSVSRSAQYAALLRPTR